MVRTEVKVGLSRQNDWAPSVPHRSFDSLAVLFGFANTPGLKYNGRVAKERYIGQFYPDELRLKELLSQGVPMLVPRWHLFGRQPLKDYDRQKRALAEKALQEKGIGFLLGEPIIGCALPVHTGGLQIAIIDGHHRTRYSSRYGINFIPSIIYTPEQMVDAFNTNYGTNETVESLREQLEKDVLEALHSFSSLPDSKIPQIVRDVRSIEELPFQRFQPLQTSANLQ